MPTTRRWSAVIGERLWERSFGRRPDAIGKSIQLNNQVFTIVGVAPARFTGRSDASEVWVSMIASVPPQARAAARQPRIPGAGAARARRVARAGAGGCHQRRAAAGAGVSRDQREARRRSVAARERSVRADSAGDLAAVRRGRVRAGDRLRERGEPAARAHRIAPP